ncbi:glutathione S-transferase family protein [Niveispirillum cyanobacteriorum]|uniref:Glutathione S-transferase n=1 Tax=Niveispirillum cyanobacteriorum TaxID=1612173 RepID=A0A2K9NBA9_9PROT|nr:glutathione S-transferase family protein [Niveispirillum cyanobacteriorum]AUN30369.1 glutathione S-transferase [Niveispirillum cyanobacteriorum]GGE55194.1 glutathione S-transferase [Niveispirillum cyanobacteriorum]
MLLYDDVIAPTPRRVRMFLAEKGVDIPRRLVTIGKGEHLSPEYRARVPSGRVPALELEDGTVISESVAICRFLEELYPEPNLMGRDAKERALIEMWQRRMEFELLLPLAGVFRHTHPKMAALECQVPAYAEAQKPQAEKRLAQLDKDLGQTEFIAGDRFTIPDITAFTTLIFFPRLCGITLDAMPNIQRWLASIADRPSANV